MHLPEHNVIPDISDNIQDVYPFPSLNSFKNSTNIIPNEYVIPSAIGEGERKMILRKNVAFIYKIKIYQVSSHAFYIVARRLAFVSVNFFEYKNKKTHFII